MVMPEMSGPKVAEEAEVICPGIRILFMTGYPEHAAEVAAVKSMVLSPEHRHMPLRTLARYAQRASKVFASVTTWARLIREHG